MQMRVDVRLLNAAGVVVDWARITALARGDQRLWAAEPWYPRVTPERVTAVVYHQPDLNVSVWADVEIPAGDRLRFDLPLMAFSTDPRPLPVVVETEPVSVTPHTGVVFGRGW